MADVTASKQFHSKTINIKLDSTNYVTWRQQVLFVVIGNGLEAYINGTPPPDEFIPQADGSLSPNPAFAEHRQVDAALASWLLSSVSTSLLPSLANCATAREIWTLLKPSSSATTNLRLLTALNSQKKGDMSIRDYLGRIQTICDTLANSNHKVTEDMQIAAILQGLGPEYDSNVALIAGSRVPYDLESASNVLYDAEVRLNEAVAKFGALTVNNTALTASVGAFGALTASVGSTSNSPSSSSGSTGGSGGSESSVQTDRSDPSQQSSNQNRTQGQGQALSYNRGRGRTQCQLCGRFGHLAARCWYRCDLTFQGFGAQAQTSYQGYRAPPPPPRPSYPPPPQPYSAPPTQPFPPTFGAHSAELVRPATHYPDYYPPPPYYYPSPPPPPYQYPYPYAPPPLYGPSLGLDDPQAHVFHATSSTMANPSSSAPRPAEDHTAWFPDSGATNHLTNSSTTMTQSSPYTGSGPKNAGGSSGGN